MVINEGVAVHAGKNLNIQCLYQREPKTTGTGHDLFHYHRYIEFLYVLKGKTQVNVNDEEYVLCKNDLMIIYMNEIHKTLFLENTDLIVVKFFPEILQFPEQSAEDYEYVFNLSNEHIRANRVISNNKKVDGFLKKAYESFSESAYADELNLRAYIMQVCAEILKTRKERGEIVSIESNIRSDNISRIQEIVQLAKETCGDLKTHDAAKMCNMSDGHFSRLFRQIMNTNFTNYTKALKISEAERLLIFSDESITSIAHKLNFSTSSHFISAFKALKGVSPKQYRKKFLS